MAKGVEMQPETEKPVWAIVEIMGHNKIAGILTEEEKFGSKLGRVEIPQPDGSYCTQYFGGGSVYRIHIVTEEVARQAAKISRPAPLNSWDFPKARQLTTTSIDHEDDIHDADWRDEDADS